MQKMIIALPIIPIDLIAAKAQLFGKWAALSNSENKQAAAASWSFGRGMSVGSKKI
jgi:hypothetical protein